MKCIITPQLQEYMKNKGKQTILVEVVVCNNAEFEVAELHVYLVDEKKAAYFYEKQGYGKVTAEGGTILLPRFKLAYSEEVVFGLRKILCFSQVTYDGIRIER